MARERLGNGSSLTLLFSEIIKDDVAADMLVVLTGKLSLTMKTNIRIYAITLLSKRKCRELGRIGSYLIQRNMKMNTSN